LAQRAKAVEARVVAAERVWINAGQRGLLLGVAPKDALAALKASVAALIA
jgi:Cys-tRNA(Pro)/Cys-tRNA(Cys) deacylase